MVKNLAGLINAAQMPDGGANALSGLVVQLRGEKSRRPDKRNTDAGWWRKRLIRPGGPTPW
ncbi:hypothetical protein ACE15K_19015 [Citrobacter farmeri]